MSGKFGNRRHNKWRGRQHSDNRNEKKKEYRHTEQLKESEVGISEFINDFEGFTGILKARFSDFQLNEIDLDGNLAKLTNTDIPKDFRLKVEKVDYKEVSQTPLDNIPQSTWEEIKQMMETSEKMIVHLKADGLSKDDRKSIHECVKKYFGSKVIASTITVDEKKILEFRKTEKSDKIDNRLQWPEDKGEYVHFIVFKELMDTLDACMKISDSLRIPCQAINYAGVKDKRGKTTQWFSVKKVEPWKLIIKTKYIKNVKIGNITFKDHPLKLGDLLGNKFRIALRNVTADNELINKSMEFVKDNGYINYYGLQRFGNDKEVPTFAIGIKLLQGEWEEATKLILKPKKSDDPFLDISKAKKVYSETGDAKRAYEKIKSSKNVCIESKLLEGLSKTGENEYVNALESIPRNMRLLYIHAFQSLIWNKMTSRRIKEFGLKPVEGDLILINNEKAVCDESIDDADDGGITCKQEVRPLKSEELDKYTIFDVVLPLPGYDIVYPEHLRSLYKEALEEFGLTLEMPKQRVKTYTLSGAYRNIISQLKDVTWKVLNYDDPNYNLIQSDFEELKGVPEPVSVENGKYKALVMEFSLNSSSYATMVIREITKMDTSTSNHAKLNDYFNRTSEKKICVTADIGSEKTKLSEIQTESSLLADKEKYEEFKNNIFKAICPAKRVIEDEESTQNKKVKVEEKNDSSIKMEASLV